MTNTANVFMCLNIEIYAASLILTSYAQLGLESTNCQ